jgi:hypothetical protein
MADDAGTRRAGRGLGLGLGPSPYPGLAAYSESEEDAARFFGRDAESRLIIANLVASRLTLLYGPSGVGKSSILRAGVLHRLRAESASADSDAPASVAVIVDRWRDAPARAIVRAVADEAARLGVRPAEPPIDEYLSLDEALAYWSERLVE